MADRGPDPARLATLVAEHDTWLAVERGVARNTRVAYARDLTKYAAFLSRRALSPDDVGEQEVATFVDELRRARDDDGRPRYAPATIARALVAVRSLHRFCAVEGLLERDPGNDVGGPRVPAGLPKALTEAEVGALLDAVTGDDPTARRDRAILETLYASGVRIGELVGLDLGDLDLTHRLLRVLGKGAKERVVPVGAPAERALREWLDVRRELVRPRSGGAVFLNRRGGRLSRQSCWVVVRAVGERAGLGPGLSPHVLRHSCATHMVDHGADIRVVQELLGHARLSTTQIYTKVSPERLRAVVLAAHPRA